MNKSPKYKQFVYNGTAYPYELHIGGVKRLNLRVRPDGSIRLSVPRATAQRQIDAFLTRCMPKIQPKLSHILSQPPRVEHELSTKEINEKKEQLLAIIRACHQNLILPRFAALAMTEQQQRFITSPVDIRIRAMKSRWGSCNFKKGTLTFNLYLLDKPMECIEYVVMHEFAHFIQPDHSPAYHALMTALMPDWRARKARLNSKN